MLKGFKDFLFRSNVIDLAVAVIIGAAFKDIVDALVDTLITPLLAAIGGQPDFSAISFSINSSEFLIGEFFNVLISFVILGAVIYFLIVMPTNKLQERVKKGEKVSKTDQSCPHCLSLIPLKAKRCKFCTQKV